MLARSLWQAIQTQWLDAKSSRINKLVGDDLRRFHKRAIADFSRYSDVENKSILEIGGDIKGRVSRAFVALGCKNVFSINVDDEFGGELLDGRIKQVQMDARNITSSGFDLAFGIAVVEHIPDLDVALDSIYQSMNPGGVAYLRGGPIWSGPVGHHLNCHGPSGQKYRFDGNCPIDNWAHLMLDEQQMQTHLAEKGCTPQDIPAILDWIYRSPKLNRYSVAELRSMFMKSKFRVKGFREITWWRQGTLSRVNAAKLRERTGLSRSELHTSAVAVILEKEN